MNSREEMLKRASALIDQVLKTWNPPEGDPALREVCDATIAQTAAMVTTAWIIGDNLQSWGLSETQQEQVDSGVELFNRLFADALIRGDE